MATERLKVILEMVAGQYKKEAREAATATKAVGTEVKTADSNTSRFGSTLRSAAVIGGIAAVGRGLFNAVEAAEQASSALANTEQIIEQTGGVANVTADDIVELSSRLSALTGVQDQIVQEGANVLLTFKNLRNEVGEGNDIFDRTAALMLDIGAVMGTDASSAALQLGKALNDPVSQMGALSRAGLTFDKEQKDLIKTLAESGDLLSAQKIILAELETQLGGTAAASADASDKIGSAFSEIAESVGTLLLPLLDTFAVELQSVVGQIDELDRLSIITGQGRDSAELLLGAFSQLSQEFPDFKDNSRDLDLYNVEAQRLVDISKLSVTELQRTRDGLDLLVDSFGLSAEEAEVFAAILDSKVNEELTKIHNQNTDQWLRSELNPALVESAEAGDVAADGLEDVTNAAGDLQRAADGAAEAQRNLRRSFLELADPIFAANEAVRRLRDAQEELSDVQADVEVSAEDVAEAQLSVAEAALGAQIALEELGDGDLAGGIARIAEALKISDEEARALLETLGILDGTRVETVVNTRFTTSGSSAPSRVNQTGTIQPRAHGGPIEAGNLYRVGEMNRPELLMIPGDNGQVFSNSDSKALIAALSGAGRQVSYNIPIQSTGNPQSDAQLVGAVASVLRRMESI